MVNVQRRPLVPRNVAVTLLPATTVDGDSVMRGRALACAPVAKTAVAAPAASAVAVNRAREFMAVKLWSGVWDAGVTVG
jgi:hypothetical protein